MGGLYGKLINPCIAVCFAGSIFQSSAVRFPLMGIAVNYPLGGGTDENLTYFSLLYLYRELRTRSDWRGKQFHQLHR